MTEKTWTVQEALNWTENYLTTKGDEHPRRSAQYLLAHATGLSRIEVYAYFDRPLSDEERSVLRESLKIRATGAPLQYACGEAAFRYLELHVTPDVLIPRSETEMLVDLVLERLAQPSDGYRPLIADIGTGSGCVALSCAHERQDARVIASDISTAALAVARANAERLDLATRVHFCEGNLAEPVFELLAHEGIAHLDALVSNPPYIPTAGMEILPRNVKEFEPQVALHGGEDGLQLFYALIEQLEAFLQKGTLGQLALELDERNVETAANYLEQRGLFARVRVVKDLTDRPRFLVAEEG